MAAKIAAPKLCPNYLENILVPVTVPRCVQGTVDWIPTIKGVVISPKPAPKVIWTKIKVPTGPGKGIDKNMSAPIQIPTKAVFLNPPKCNLRTTLKITARNAHTCQNKPAAIAPKPVSCAKRQYIWVHCGNPIYVCGFYNYSFFQTQRAK